MSLADDSTQALETVCTTLNCAMRGHDLCCQCVVCSGLLVRAEEDLARLHHLVVSLEQAREEGHSWAADALLALREETP